MEPSTPNFPATDPRCEVQPILLVDDDPTFRSALAAILAGDGHAVHDYGAPSEVPTLATLGHIAAVITDYEMPGENGLAFADRFHAAHPRVPVVLVTGHRMRQLEDQAATREFLYLLRKPIDYDELHALLHLVWAGAHRERSSVSRVA